MKDKAGESRESREKAHEEYRDQFKSDSGMSTTKGNDSRTVSSGSPSAESSNQATRDDRGALGGDGSGTEGSKKWGDGASLGSSESSEGGHVIGPSPDHGLSAAMEAQNKEVEGQLDRQVAVHAQNEAEQHKIEAFARKTESLK